MVNVQLQGVDSNVILKSVGERERGGGGGVRVV